MLINQNFAIITFSSNQFHGLNKNHKVVGLAIRLKARVKPTSLYSKGVENFIKVKHKNKYSP